MKLSITIPLFNEEKRFPEKIAPYLFYLRSVYPNYELVLVDDGSTDGTLSYIEELARKDHRIRIIRHSINRGRGAGMKTGVTAATGDIILETDADLPVPPETIQIFLDYFTLHPDCMMLVGSRSNKASKFLEPQPFRRVVAGYGFHALFGVFFFVPSWDVMCGFKMFRRKAVEEIFPYVFDERYLTAGEVIFVARRRGLLYKELSVEWCDGRNSKVHIIRDSFRTLSGMWAMAVRRYKGFYD